MDDITRESVKVCECKLCIRTKKFRASLEKIPESEREFWIGLHDDLYHVEVDRDYYKSIVDGSWPNADEVISNNRSRPKV
jgi:hypothetical protein